MIDVTLCRVPVFIIGNTCLALLLTECRLIKLIKLCVHDARHRRIRISVLRHQLLELVHVLIRYDSPLKIV